jgi:hypothetical protein
VDSLQSVRISTEGEEMRVQVSAVAGEDRSARKMRERIV